MANGVIAVQEPASPTKRMDTTELTVAAVVVERERIQLAGAGAAELADVRNVAPGGTDYGQVVRPVETGAANIATAQATVPATAGGIVLAAARATRRSVTIINTGTVDVYIGAAGVTITTGELLVGVKGAGLVFNTTAAIVGIVAAGTQVVTVREEYD